MRRKSILARARRRSLAWRKQRGKREVTGQFIDYILSILDWTVCWLVVVLLHPRSLKKIRMDYTMDNLVSIQREGLHPW